MRVNRIPLLTLSIQVVAWMLIVMTVPVYVYLMSNDMSAALNSISMGLRGIAPWFLIFYINYLILIPKGLFEDRKWLFYVGNLVLLAIHLYLNITHMHHGRPPGPQMPPFNPNLILGMSCTFVATLQLLITLLALGFRFMIRYYRLKEKSAHQKQEATEAELQWLKSQLNPHFLFNTLNNISSLTQIDADKAQDSIGQLSELLRYAMYETADEFVPLGREMQFMRNYIDLMALRCNESTAITVDFSMDPDSLMIAPLLFICPIENAFKHGVNARMASFVEVSLSMEGHDLVFVCRNSVNEHAEEDRAGHGIGLANLQKRLDLIYPGRYSYLTKVECNVYTCEIKIKGIC